MKFNWKESDSRFPATLKIADATNEMIAISEKYGDAVFNMAIGKLLHGVCCAINDEEAFMVWKDMGGCLAHLMLQSMPMAERCEFVDEMNALNDEIHKIDSPIPLTE